MPPVSSVGGVAGQLLERGLLSAPTQPGLLASLGGYDVVSVVGEGGMGFVLKGRDARTRQEVAIKILKPDMAAQPQQVHRFLKEARHMRRLKHPCIVPVLQVSEEEDRPYFVMPYLERGSLARWISPDAPLSEDEILAIARALASALAYAHSRGVIHRDLKPGNVLLDGADQVFLSDFGLARTVFNDSWIDPGRPESCEGTAPYMSPQLARGEAEDTRCDIYALGALLYEMLTGRPPYEGQSTAEILRKIQQGPPPPILKLNPKAPDGLVQVAQGAMAREHRDRYANMEDLARDLERLQEGQFPTGPRNRLRFRLRQVGRHPAVWAVGVLAVVLTGMLLRARPERSAAPRLELVRSLAPEDIRSWASAQVGECTGDDQTDIAVVQDGRLHIFSTADGTRKAVDLKQSCDKAMWLSLLADVDGDGLAEAIIAWPSGTNGYLAAFNSHGYAVRRFRKSGSLNVHPTWGTNYTELHALQLVDLDRDGRQELLAKVNSTWALQPRGLVCFDVESGAEKWFFPMAGFVSEVTAGDLDGDRQEEILVGSNSPSNGAQLPDGTKDSEAYLYALSSDGSLLWRKRLCDYFATVAPLGFARNATGSTDIVLWVTSLAEHHIARGDPETGVILRMDAKGDIRRRYDVGVQLTGALMADLGSEGSVEVFAADRTGRLHVLDQSLGLLKVIPLVTNNLTWVDLKPVLPLRPGPNVAGHLVLTSSTVESRTPPVTGSTAAKVPVFQLHDNQLILMGENLTPGLHHTVSELWSQNPGFQVRGQDGGDGRPTKLFVFTSKADLYEFRSY
jgi:outer membrane protein assembly factor BamB